MPGFLKLLAVQHFAAHHEADGAAGVHHVAAYAAVQVFVPGNRAQHFAGQRIGHVARQHLGADFFQLYVNAFERIGRILSVGIKQFEQHFFRVFNQPWRAPGTHP